MPEKTKTFFSHSSTAIPAWMTSMDAVLQGKPAPSMRGPGIPQAWMETWEALEMAIQSHVSAATSVAQEMQHSPVPWPQNMADKIYRISTEPTVPLDALHVVATGRGLIFLVAPQGFVPGLFPDGMMMVTPWSREDLTGWTHFRGDSELVDQRFAQPWAWAAWRCRKLLSLTPRQSPGPMELTVPNFLALQAAGILK